MSYPIPEREPDVVLPSHGDVSKVSVWVKENLFRINNRDVCYNEINRSGDEHFDSAIKYLESVANDEVPETHPRKRAAGLFLIELGLLSDDFLEEF